MHEKSYIDALYCFQEMLEEDFAAFVEECEQTELDEGRIKYADRLMHLAKNMRKEIFAEEGLDPETGEGDSGTAQSYGRAIRTTPGMGDSGTHVSTYNGRSMRSSYRGTSGMSGRGTSDRRDARGRFARSGAAEQDTYARLQKMADMTVNQDERTMILRMIDRLKAEEQE